VSAVRPHPDCTRAREWASLDLDGELSDFERFLLDAHIATCSDCHDFRVSIAGFAADLRAAPLEQLERPVVVRRRRRAMPVRRLPAAAAALAVAVVGLGSLLASFDLRNVSGPAAWERPGAVDTRGTSLLQQAGIQRRQIMIHRRQVASSRRSDLRGGPVLG